MTGIEGINFCTIRINENKCDRCYECIKYCYNNALTLDKGIFMHNAYECAYCELCMDICSKNCLEILDM